MFSDQRSKHPAGNSHTLGRHACPSLDLAASSCEQLIVSLFGLSTPQMQCQREEWVWTLSSAKAWQVRDVAAVTNSSLVLRFVKIRMILGNMSIYMNIR